MGRDAGRRDQAGAGKGDPDTGDTYYRHWLNALERLVAEKGVAAPADLSRYRDAWHRAADRTPHGMPIALQSEDFARSSDAVTIAVAWAFSRSGS